MNKKLLMVIIVLLVSSPSIFSQTISQKNVNNIKESIRNNDLKTFEKSIQKAFKYAPAINSRSFDNYDLISYLIRCGKPRFLDPLINNYSSHIKYSNLSVGRGHNKQSIINTAWDVKKAKIKYEEDKKFLSSKSATETSFKELLKKWRDYQSQKKFLDHILSKEDKDKMHLAWMKALLDRIETYQENPTAMLNWMTSPYGHAVDFPKPLAEQTKRISKKLYSEVLAEKMKKIDAIPLNYTLENIYKNDFAQKVLNDSKHFFWQGRQKEKKYPDFLDVSAEYEFWTYIKAKTCAYYDHNYAAITQLVNETKRLLQNNDIKGYQQKSSDLRYILFFDRAKTAQKSFEQNEVKTFDLSACQSYLPLSESFRKINSSNETQYNTLMYNLNRENSLANNDFFLEYKTPEESVGRIDHGIYSIYKGDFKGLDYEFDDYNEDILITIIANQFMRIQAKKCYNSPSSINGKVPITDDVCSQYEANMENGIEVSRTCVEYVEVPTGLYTSPELATAFKKLKKKQNSLSGLINFMAASLDAWNLSIAKQIPNEIEKLLNLNGCDSKAIKRFEENLIRYMNDNEPLLLK